MAYLRNYNGTVWIVEKKNKKEELLKNLGKISKEEAREQLTIWKEETKRLEEWKNKVVPMPKGEFDIIYADPPWRYTDAVENRKIENHYPTMETSDICKLKIPTAENSILFLWGTSPKLIDALKVIDAWGFKYKTGAVWDKKRIGMGYYFRIQHEHLFIATRGSPGIPDEKSRPDSIFSQAKTQHSVKPDIVYEMIEKMYPQRKYLELFARKKFNDKWAVWGNEV